MFKRRFSSDSDRGGFAPINVGDELDVTIEAVGGKGDGIAKIKGFVIFVPGTKQGETVKIKINKVLRKVGFAEVIGKGSKEDVDNSNKEESETESSYNEESTEASEEIEASPEVEDSEEFGEES